MKEKYPYLKSGSWTASQFGSDSNVTNYKADNGLSCLLTVIIVLSLIGAGLFYFGLF